MKMNIVTLHKIVETMQMHSIIKAKGGPTKYYSVRLLFFGSVWYNQKH